RLRVVGKGNKERELAVPPLVAEALDDYLPTRKACLDRLGVEAETVLISTRSRPVKDRSGRVVGQTVDNPVRAVSYAVDRILKRAGAKRQGVRVHALRHTFASVGLHEGILNLRELQAALGHASLSTTERYTHVGDDALAAGMRAHPLGQRRHD
ncbi:MAG: tyrosine-type recombinase/integrase, partial [Acidimicrobiales bacterium]